MDINKELESQFLNMALDYKKQYESTSWWKFRKRKELYKNWQSAKNLMVRYGLKIMEEEKIMKLINRAERGK